MQTHSATSEVTREGAQTEATFTIKATSKAFDILSSGLYSDKIQAIVRELSCNAYDAHVAAGKADQPIEIRLPTTMDPTFYVKDYGIGLDHEGITQLYTTYFESTKTTSNDFIGALGLGSKSPFSYASTFIVEARHEGVKRVYTAFKNEHGMPSISLMGEEATDESNGLTVMLSIRPADMDKFYTAARKALMYFTPRPVVVGRTAFEPFTMTHTVKGSDWCVRQSEWSAHMNGPYVVQGFVAYPVDASIMREHTPSENVRALCGMDLDLYVPIGEVEVAASREALSYDARTIANLAAAFDRAANEMRQTFQQKFDACSSRWEAAMTYDMLSHDPSETFRTLFAQMHNDVEFTWRGDPVGEVIRLDLTDVKTTCIVRYVRQASQKRLVNASSWQPYTISDPTHVRHDVRVTSQVYVFIDKEPKGGVEAIKAFLETKPRAASSSKREPTALILRPTQRNAYSQAEIDDILTQLGNPPTLNISDLPKPVREKTGYVKRQKTHRMVFTGFAKKALKRRWWTSETSIHRVFSRNTWNTVEVDLANGGFFVHVDRFNVLNRSTPYNPHVNVKQIDVWIEFAITLGIIPKSAQIYGFNANEYKTIDGNPKWVELFSYIAEKVKALTEDPEVFGAAATDALTEKFKPYSTLMNAWPQYVNDVNDGAFKSVMQTVHAALTAPSSDIDLQTLKHAADMCGCGITAEKVEAYVSTFATSWNVMFNAYPMLAVLDWAQLKAQHVDRLCDYVNLIDQLPVAYDHETLSTDLKPSSEII